MRCSSEVFVLFTRGHCGNGARALLHGPNKSLQAWIAAEAENCMYVCVCGKNFHTLKVEEKRNCELLSDHRVVFPLFVFFIFLSFFLSMTVEVMKGRCQAKADEKGCSYINLCNNIIYTYTLFCFHIKRPINRTEVVITSMVLFVSASSFPLNPSSRFSPLSL